MDRPRGNLPAPSLPCRINISFSYVLVYHPPTLPVKKTAPNHPIGNYAVPYFAAVPVTSMTTNSDQQPVLNWMAQSEMPEVTTNFVSPRVSVP